MKVPSSMKKIAVLPTLLTLGNAVCGFAAIALASKITPETESYYLGVSGWLILGAMVFDALDGYVARLSKTASDFGGQLDSLCDAISFGAAPAFLLLKMGPGFDTPRLHQLVALSATLYLVCVILRLARFNVENNPDPAYHKRFRGLPSPGAAGCLASLAILRGELPRWPTLDTEAVRSGVEMWAMFGAMVVALLMVSRLPYPHMTKQLLRGRRNFAYLVQIILGVFVLWMIQDLAPLLLFWTYALAIPVYVLVRGWRRGPTTAPDVHEQQPH